MLLVTNTFQCAECGVTTGKTVRVQNIKFPIEIGIRLAAPPLGWGLDENDLAHCPRHLPRVVQPSRVMDPRLLRSIEGGKQ